MRSATSCSKTLIRSDWRRFWPAAFLYAFISFFMLPLILWINQPVAGDFSSFAGREIAEVVLDVIPGFVILNFFFGLILAMAVYGYLMTSRSVGLMHALPVSRGRQFLSHFAAGMSMLTAGNLLTLLLSLGMEAVMGAVELRSLLLWLVITELSGFFFLAFATLCAVITGWLLAVPVIYAGFNFVVLIYWAILDGLAGILYPSYVDVSFSRTAVEWLTPVVNLVATTSRREVLTLRPGVTAQWLSPLAMPTVLIYTAAGLAMLGVALFLYRRRHSESAGDPVVFKPLRPVARYMISVAGGLALGTLVHQMITWGGRNAIALILWQLLMGGVVYCAVEMLLRKSYKIFNRRTAVGLLALWLVLAGVTGAMAADITGFEKRVPDPGQVESVELRVGNALSDNCVSSDPDTIRAAMELHRALKDQGEIQEPWGMYSVGYHLNTGMELTRRYSVDLTDRAVYQALTNLLNRPELRAAMLVENYGKYGDTFLYGYAETFTGKEIVLTPEQCLAVYRALESDMARTVTPEQVENRYTGFNLELSTPAGSYRIWQLRGDCRNTLDALLEIGLIDSVDELEYEAQAR